MLINDGGKIMQYDAIILAGGESCGELKKIAPYDNEALIIIGSYPMIYYVYRALRNSLLIRNIIISGPADSLRSIIPKEDNVFFVESGDNAIESFGHAFRLLQKKGMTDHLLIMPTDIPLITTEAIDDFIYKCKEQEADFYYSITTKQVNDIKFPGVSRTYVNLDEGTFTGGNLFLIKNEIVDKAMDIALQLVERRKSPLAMARLFGLRLVLKYLTKSLSIIEVEKRFHEVVHIKGKAIISAYAEVGVDVDKPSDLEIAQRYLAKISL